MITPATVTGSNSIKTEMIGLDDITVPPDRRKLQQDKVDELAESIRERGLIHPILVRPSRGIGYTLIAGRHRLAAVKQLKHEDIRTEIRDGLDADEAELLEIDENLIRADLSPAERALHLAERKRLYLKSHPETESVRVRGGPGRGRKNESQNATRNPAFIDDTASRTGKHRATIAREVARAKIADLADVPGTCLDEGYELDALVKLPEPVQRDLITRAKAGEHVTAKHVAYKLRREKRERELGAATEAASKALGKKLYAVIYADPPWKFEVYAESGMDAVADNHYPTMSIEQIKAMLIPAAANCVLFLWTTVPMMAKAIDVMANSWGFTYKSAAFWKKDPPGNGYWFRNEVEVLLVGTRGNVPAPALGDQPRQLIEALRGRHSEKPEVFAAEIERLYPHVPKLEMFARKARPGWDVWGNEVPALDRPMSVPMPDKREAPQLAESCGAASTTKGTPLRARPANSAD